MSCGAVVIARNEEKVIRKCLESLRDQTVKVLLVVVNDGSVDRTTDLASKYADIVLDLPRHEETWAGKPELAKVFNAGFESLANRNVEYVLISGADNIYPSNYVEEIVNRMKTQKAVLASGIAQGESFRSLSPRGAGRIVEVSWFKSLGFCYPENYGFEVYIVFKALAESRKVAVFPDLKFKVSRGTRHTRGKLFLWGKGMRALNYWWLYAFGRAMTLGVKRPLNGFALLEGYLSETSTYDDLRDFVPRFQKRMLIRRMIEILGR